MKITKFLEIAQEFEIDIGLGDIVNAYEECSEPERVECALRAIGGIPKIFDPIPDSTIAQMSEGQRNTIKNYLLKVADRF
jgi:hypothetical protein